MYYKRPARKSIVSYFLPFLVIGLIFAGVVFGWRALNNVFIDSNKNTFNEKVFLSIESGSAKAMTVGKSEWQNAPDKIYLYRGEKLKTGSDGRVTLTLFDQSIMRMNTETEVEFSTLKKKNDTYSIDIEIKKGSVWTKVERITNPDSAFSLTTDLLTIDTRGAVFALTYPGTIYVTEGSVQVGVKYDDNVIKTYTVGVGQQLVVDKETIGSIKRGDDVDVIFALSDTFKKTNWYRWNIKKDGAISAFEESDLSDETPSEEDTDTSVTEGEKTTDTSDEIANIGRLVYVTKPSANFETNKSSLTVEGKFDEEKIQAVYVDGKKASDLGEGKWKITGVKLTLEGENDFEIEAEDLSGSRKKVDTLTVIYDKTPPETPVIEDPVLAEGESKVAIEDIEQIISGSVSKDTQAVIVNDYRLGKYVPGSGEFTYYAKTEYGNLEAGENEYKVYAEDKAGNQSEAATIILELDQKVIDEAGVNSADETGAGSETVNTESLTPASSSGGVKITAPNSGESFTTNETEFEIEGTVPEGTASVSVNNYKLSLFKAGDTAFKYRAFVSIGNLKIGEKNTYTVKAFDPDDKAIGEASITIDVESGASAGPVISIPSDTGSYTTSLDTIVVGGTVGKWVTRMYINDKEIKDYIPGSEKFRTSVTLSPGENNFTVTAEKSGEQVGKATIMVKYQQ